MLEAVMQETRAHGLVQVAGHSRFKSNPLSAVAAHLEATLPKPEPQRNKLNVRAKPK